MKTLALVSCTAGKLAHRARAGDLYQSDWFAKAKAYAQTHSAWFILSAKHGLVDPSAELEPYDQALHDMTKAERQAWAATVADQLRAIKAERCIVLAGQLYRDPLMPHLAKLFPAISLPLAGLGIGAQKRELKTLFQKASQ